MLCNHINDKLLKKLESTWLVACQSSELTKKKPLAVTVLSRKIVLFRSDSDVAAIEDRCPHRNVPLSSGTVVKGNIQCPYHGWTFDKNGRCTKVPSLNKNQTPRCQIPSFNIHDDNQFVWIQISPNSHSTRPSYPLVEKNKKKLIFSVFKFEFQSHLIDLIENLFDPFHTHYVHKNLLRSHKANYKQLLNVKITSSSQHVEIVYSGEKKQSGLISKIFESNRRASYSRFTKPIYCEIEYCSLKGTSTKFYFFITPREDNFFDVYSVITSPSKIIPSLLIKPLFHLFFKKLAAQDKIILKKQAETIQNFQEPKFRSTHLDLIRPYLECLILSKENSNFPQQKEQKIRI